MISQIEAIVDYNSLLTINGGKFRSREISVLSVLNPLQESLLDCAVRSVVLHPEFGLHDLLDLRLELVHQDLN